MDSFARKLRSLAGGGGGGGGGGGEADQANGPNGIHLQNEEDLTPLPSLNNKVSLKHFVRDKKKQSFLFLQSGITRQKRSSVKQRRPPPSPQPQPRPQQQQQQQQHEPTSEEQLLQLQREYLQGHGQMLFDASAVQVRRNGEENLQINGYYSFSRILSPSSFAGNKFGLSYKKSTLALSYTIVANILLFKKEETGSRTRRYARCTYLTALCGKVCRGRFLKVKRSRAEPSLFCQYSAFNSVLAVLQASNGFPEKYRAECFAILALASERTHVELARSYISRLFSFFVQRPPLHAN